MLVLIEQLGLQPDVLLSGVFFVTGIKGSSFWNETSPLFGWNYGHLVVVFFLIASPLTVASNLWNVYAKHADHFKRTLYNTITFGYLIFTLVAITKLAPEVLNTHLR